MDAKTVSVRIHLHAGLFLVAAFEAPAHIEQAEAAAAGGSGLGIKRIFDGDGKPPVLTLRSHANGSAVRQIGDSVHHGVLYQRLQQERRNQESLGLVLNGFFDAQPGAMADYQLTGSIQACFERLELADVVEVTEYITR